MSSLDTNYITIQQKDGSKYTIKPGECFLLRPTHAGRPNQIARIIRIEKTKNPPHCDRAVTLAQIYVFVEETILASGVEWDPKEVFLLPQKHILDLARLLHRVEVSYRNPLERIDNNMQQQTHDDNKTGKKEEKKERKKKVESEHQYFYSWSYEPRELAFSDPSHVEKKLWKEARDVIDLYAGCGGLSYGLDSEGMNTRWAVEWDKAAAKTWVKNHPEGRMFCCSVVDLLKFVKAKGPDSAEETDRKYKHIFPEDAYWTRPVEAVFDVRFDETSASNLEYRVRFKGEEKKEWVNADEIQDDVQLRIWKKENEDKWLPLHRRYREVKRYTDLDVEKDAELVDADIIADKQEEHLDEDDEVILEDDSDVEELSKNGAKKPQRIGDQWVVREIKDIRINKVGKYEYLVGWQGCPDSDDTWEPEGNVMAGSLVAKFMKSAFVPKKLFPCRKTVGYIVGGPPCQGFSNANFHRDSKHPFRGKNRGVSHFLQYVAHFEPRGILVENVVGMLDHGGGVVPRSVVKQLLLWGYQVRVTIASAACYGVPQRRWRVLIFGAKTGEVLPKLEPPTHWVDTSKWISGSVAPLGTMPREWLPGTIAPSTTPNPSLTRCPDLREAICDLPPHASVSDKGFTLYQSKPMSHYQVEMRKYVKGNVVWNNRGRTSVNAFQWKMYEPTHLFVTITCQIRAMNEPALHPIYQRPMTTREHARGQSFPDHFHFVGTQGQVYMQIGNAVPCLLGRAIARAFICADQYLASDRPWPKPRVPVVTDIDPDESEIAKLDKTAKKPPFNVRYSEAELGIILPQSEQAKAKKAAAAMAKTNKSKAAGKAKQAAPKKNNNKKSRRFGSGEEGSYDDDPIVMDSDASEPREEDDAIDIESDESEDEGVMSDVHSDDNISDNEDSRSGSSISDSEELWRVIQADLIKLRRRTAGEVISESEEDSRLEERLEMIKTRKFMREASKYAKRGKAGDLSNEEDDFIMPGSNIRGKIVEKPVSEFLKQQGSAPRTRTRVRQEKVTAYVISDSDDDDKPSRKAQAAADDDDDDMEVD